MGVYGGRYGLGGCLDPSGLWEEKNPAGAGQMRIRLPNENALDTLFATEIIYLCYCPFFLGPSRSLLVFCAL